MSETGPHPEPEDDNADEQTKREAVRREEEAGTRYSAEDVFGQLDEQAKTLEGGETAGEQKLQDETVGQGVEDALAGALRADKEKQKQEELPSDATFFSVEQGMSADAKLEAIADNSADEQNLVGMIGACRQVGKEIFEHKDKLSFSDRAIFEKAAEMLHEAEGQHQSSLKAFRRHLLEGNGEEATKDFHFYVESLLGRSLDAVTAQWRVLERMKYTLDHSKKQ